MSARSFAAGVIATLSAIIAIAIWLARRIVDRVPELPQPDTWRGGGEM